MRETARDLGRLDPPPGPFAVVCDKQHGGLGHRGPRLDEGLDARPAPDELRKVVEIGLVNPSPSGSDRSRAPSKPSHFRSPSSQVPQGYDEVTCLGAPARIERVQK
ncbi:hypothetical protein GCM10010168_70180 [Actinoplanes ianthinogenes]|uniref:Uncharacterized protein n=1 Tax=Actinoplanes ianthinogenes TaxID=122358 RepID=A0ABM7M0V0_9ACTN|nr:hypothetical protein Aiant_58740 [Actinoplanes ianthinogenes]GGR41362.1 hypothetical protein GCM10010168_70180 [Actinoplanes ianthinogenes]